MKVQTNFRAGMSVSGGSADFQPEIINPSGPLYGADAGPAPAHAFNAWLQALVSPGKTGEPSTKVITVDTLRLWEIDTLRGISLGVMFGLHFTNSWLKVISSQLAALVDQAWLGWIRPVCVVTLCLPVLAGAVFSAPYTHPRLAELRQNGSVLARMALTGAQVLTLAWLFYWAMTTSVNAIPFILLSGVSLAVSAGRAQARGNPHPFGYYLNRGALLLASGLLITLLSAWMLPASLMIHFNVLHLLGLGTILAYPFLQQPAWVSLGAGLGIVGVTPLLAQLPFLTNLGWLSSWLVVMQGLDFAPMFPWLGAVLLGVSTGLALYPDGQRSFQLPDFSRYGWVRSLSSLSRNSLAVYLAQSPVFFAGVALAGA